MRLYVADLWIPEVPVFEKVILRMDWFENTWQDCEQCCPVPKPAAYTSEFHQARIQTSLS